MLFLRKLSKYFSKHNLKLECRSDVLIDFHCAKMKSVKISSQRNFYDPTILIKTFPFHPLCPKATETFPKNLEASIYAESSKWIISFAFVWLKCCLRQRVKVETESTEVAEVMEKSPVSEIINSVKAKGEKSLTLCCWIFSDIYHCFIRV